MYTSDFDTKSLTTYKLSGADDDCIAKVVLKLLVLLKKVVEAMKRLCKEVDVDCGDSCNQRKQTLHRTFRRYFCT